MDDQQQSRQGIPQTSPPAQVEQPKAAATPEESRQELKNAIWDANEVLVEARTVFTFFPDTMAIDRTKLTVTKRDFFNTSEVMSIRIEDISNVTANVGPFFGSIKIVSRILNAEKPFQIGLFFRKDAMKLKCILQGYIVALQKNIDCSSLGTKELAKLLDKLGQDEHGQTKIF